MTVKVGLHHISPSLATTLQPTSWGPWGGYLPGIQTERLFPDRRRRSQKLRHSTAYCNSPRQSQRHEH
ncbi:MAG: hypothetical protein AAB433_16105, partial [Nitrospirota bacterium]